MIFFQALSIGEAIMRLMRGDVPMRFTAYDGSSVGPQDAPVGFHLRNERGLAFLVTAPGELGLSRAYINGDLELSGVHPGDPYDILSILKVESMRRMPTPADIVTIARALDAHTFVPPTPPPQERLPRWRRAAEGLRRGNDERGPHRHRFYEVSNNFYASLLGEQMTHSTARFEHPDTSLEDAQLARFDRVCRQLALEPGQRLLDVGCGWGTFVRFAAREYGVRALGITRSLGRAQWAKEAIDREGLADLVEVRHRDYRDVVENGFDAVSAFATLESVVVHRHAGYFDQMARRLRPGGRFLGHYLVDGTDTRRPIGAFTERYILPGTELGGSTAVKKAASRAGLEILASQDLTDDFVATVTHWSRNLVAHWDECTEEISEGSAKVWGLHLANARHDAELGVTTQCELLAARQ